MSSFRALSAFGQVYATDAINKAFGNLRSIFAPQRVAGVRLKITPRWKKHRGRKARRQAFAARMKMERIANKVMQAAYPDLAAKLDDAYEQALLTGSGFVTLEARAQ